MAEKSFWNEKKDKEWFSNFLFYYSKHMIAIVFVVIIVVGSCISCANRVEYDLEMYYLSDKNISNKVFDNATQTFSKVIDDIDAEHGKVAFVHNLTIYTDNTANAQMNMAMTMKAFAEMSEGNGYLYIMNEDWKNYCEEDGLLGDISKYTGNAEPHYALEITDNKLMNDLGVKIDGKLYVGVRVLNSDRSKDKMHILRHNNAIKALQYIIENK